MSGEMDFTRRICKDLESDGAMIFPIVASKMQKPGWPDRLVAHRYALFLLEFKGEKTPISAVQKSVHSALARRGRYVFLAREPGDLCVAQVDGYLGLGQFTCGAGLADLVRLHLLLA